MSITLNKNKGGRPKSQVQKTCLVCDASFSVRKSMSDSKYCSYKCYWNSKKGKPSWNKGMHFNVDEKHPQWKGSKVSYRAIHSWVERKLGKPNKCEKCQRTAFGRFIHWANVSGKYKRDLSDWVRFCAKCHKNYDVSKSLC